ncbi:hypothetical protein GMJAKD_07680 [Candidatus Electrothrix aarhusensis]
MIHFGHVALVNLLECNESGQLVLKLSDFAALEGYQLKPGQKVNSKGYS